MKPPRLDLQKIRLAAQNVFDERGYHAMAGRLRVDDVSTVVGERLAHRLVTHLWGRDIRDGLTVVRHPADWWEAVKERFFPAWALGRWPVKYTEHRVPTHVSRVCPHLAVPDESAEVTTYACLNWLAEDRD